MDEQASTAKPGGPKEIPPEDQRREIEFLEGVRARLPTHSRVLESLGLLYNRVGRHVESLEVDRQLVRLQPESSVVWYNLACSLSQTGQLDEAFSALERAIDLGGVDSEWMNQDEDLAPMREDLRFYGLMARLEGREKA